MCLEYQEKLEVQETIQRQVVYGPRLERSVRVCTQLLHSRSGEDEENSDVANEHYVRLCYMYYVSGESRHKTLALHATCLTPRYNGDESTPFTNMIIHDMRHDVACRSAYTAHHIKLVIR